MTISLSKAGRVVVYAILMLAASVVHADRARQILDATGVKGGLIVHIGCADGKLTAALHANDSFLVHGLDGDAGNIEKARKHIRSLGLYGKVSVEHWTQSRLPYADNMVNLIVSEDIGDVPIHEVMRVLAPRGVLYVRTDGKWTRTVKPWPEGMDEWTHWLYDASNNAVVRDSVIGPPRRLQWAAGPSWQRHHDTVPGTTAMVAANGRLFYTTDEAPACLDVTVPDKRFLVARDAFNGVLLWKRPQGKSHLVATDGLRSADWFNRTHWTVGPARGQLLVFGDNTAYAIQAYPGTARWGFFHPGDKGYLLAAVSLKRGTAKKGKAANARGLWAMRVPVRATAMVLAGKNLFLAGAPDVVDADDPAAAFEGRKGAKLWVVSSADGKKLAEYDLEDIPVFDGLAAAGGRLYMATTDGYVLSFEDE